MPQKVPESIGGRTSSYELKRRTLMPHPGIDLVAAIAPMAVIAVDLVALTHALSASFARRLALAAVGGSWVGLAMYLSASGRLANSPASTVPWMGLLLVAPLLIIGATALAAKNVRASLLAIPMDLLIGLNALRILGVIFLLDFSVGTLRGPFPFFAGAGDIITGALAIPLALRIAGSRQPSPRTIAGWNAFGVMDLVVAVGLAITSVPGSPLQLIHVGVGSQAMQYLPMSLVPAVLVPFYLMTHAIVAAQLRSRSRSNSQATPGGWPRSQWAEHSN
jgi:hypothetical protein